MVLINGIKYACERCIRGHRVTTCNHTDQPLMMIKPKGRPSTTCAYCKELRKKKSTTSPGTCTCGRLEKKRLAQKAKEEARAKAKELASQNCTCKTNPDEICKVHSNKRIISGNRKNMIPGGVNSGNNVNNGLYNSSRSNSVSQRKGNNKHRPKFERVPSSASLDSNFLSSNNVLSDSSSFIGSTFLDTDNGSGKISKDYHHVPSLASISSLHSSQSLDQNFSSPQSPQFNGMQFNFLNDGINNSHHNIVKNRSHVNNWDSNSISNASDSQLNLLESNVGIGLDPLNATKRITPLTRTHVGEVVIPLEEYVPNDINGVGKVNDTNDWSFEDNSINKGYNTGATGTSETDDYLKENNTSMNSNNSNGLLDMFSDSSSISTLSRANLLLQERHGNSNIIPNYRSFNDRSNSNSHSVQQSNRGNSAANATSNDTQSIRSVGVLSLTPSFMDIPDYDSSTRRQKPSRKSMSNNHRPRSSSLDRNHKYAKNSPGHINPNIMTTIDDGVSINSFQSHDTINPLVNIKELEHPDNFMINENYNNNENNINSFNTGGIQDIVENPDSSPIHSAEQATNLPSNTTQLLSEQGFADLDNFMSSLN